MMAPVAKLRAALMNLSAEGRVIDENLFFFAAGMEAAAGDTSSLRPACTRSLRPAYTKSLRPAYTGSLRPAYTRSLRPAYTSSARAAYNGSLRPHTLRPLHQREALVRRCY